MTDVPESIAITNDGLELPVGELLTGRGFITGKSGSGKSNTASVIAEELLEHGLPLMIVDTDGEYYGLQERYQILHAAVDDTGDIEVGPDDAERLAGLALDGNVPIVLDISGYMDIADGLDLVDRVLREIFRMEDSRRKPFLVVIEEIHEYLPERGGHGKLGELLIQIAKRGRKRGLGLCGISQRPAAVSKDFITQCDWLVWHRLTWENDIRVVRKLLGNDAADQIQSLDDGEAFLMTDWDDEIQRIRFKRKRTLDAGATPDIANVAGGPEANLDADVLEALDIDETTNETVEQTPGEKERQIRTLEQRVEELEEELAREREWTDDSTDTPAQSSNRPEEAHGGFLIQGLSEVTSLTSHAVRVTVRRLVELWHTMANHLKGKDI